MDFLSIKEILVRLALSMNNTHSSINDGSEPTWIINKISILPDLLNICDHGNKVYHTKQERLYRNMDRSEGE